MVGFSFVPNLDAKRRRLKMKKLLSIVAALAITLALGVPAFAGSAGGSAPAVGKVNVPLTVPKVSKSACKTLTAGAHNVTTFDVSKTTMVNWRAITSSTNSTLVIVKRTFDSNSNSTEFFPADQEHNLPIDTSVTNLGFSNFSAASPATTTTVCVDMN
jgi:hypothetical protein